ncbi:unnamed protein product [Anisakis simplex]|uniref:Putative rab15, 13, 10, 1, 35, 5, and (inferred by orthology to a S. mansoni protein) n=1 Tax=Anisakis simplex TaxID=6269 RepID=A0A158PNF3_ANISI|nr:unnamed protein product [Anisakis simplex]
MSYNYLFKIVVVGDHNCGKSCILLRFAENSFRHDHISTLGVDFKLKTIKLGRDKIRLELWDTAGMERYRTIYNSYYHSAHGVMCVYDLTDERSFENLQSYWLKEIRSNAPSNAVLMLVGNKADLEDQRKVDFDRAEQLASRLGVSLYEVSAKTGINCEEAFQNLAAAMRDRLLVSNMHSDSEDDDHLSSAFHVDGVSLPDKRKSIISSCCSSAPPPAFV